MFLRLAKTGKKFPIRSQFSISNFSKTIAKEAALIGSHRLLPATTVIMGKPSGANNRRHSSPKKKTVRRLPRPFRQSPNARQKISARPVPQGTTHSRCSQRDAKIRANPRVSLWTNYPMACASGMQRPKRLKETRNPRLTVFVCSRSPWRPRLGVPIFPNRFDPFSLRHALLSRRIKWDFPLLPLTDGRTTGLQRPWTVPLPV